MHAVILFLLTIVIGLGAFGADVYVATGGVDASGRGTQASPYKTIRYAVNQISSGKVYVAPGTYAEVATLNGIVAGAGCVPIEKAVEVIGSSGNPADVIITHGAWPGSGQSPIVKLDNAGAAIRHVTVYDGTYQEGGNVYVTANGGTVDHCIIRKTSNAAWNAKGTSALLHGGRMTRTKVCENEVASPNGQVYADGSALIDNCLLCDLTCGANYAALIEGTAKMVNCSIVRNTGTTGSGVKVNKNTAKVINCLIADNVAITGISGPVWSGSNPASFINCATDIEIAGSTGNVYCRPSYLNFDAADFRQSVISQCIDAGADVSSYGIGDLDLEGRPRIAGTIDIGCYENDKTTASLGFTFGLDHVQSVRDYSSECISQTMPATLSLHAGLCGGSGAVTYRWTLTDAKGVTYVRESTQPDLDWDVPACGRFDIKLEVAGMTSSRKECFLVSPRLMYVTAGSTHPLEPYDTPETAATSIASAYKAAATGATLFITPNGDGELVQGAEFHVLRGVSFVGYTGNPVDTVLRNSNPMSDGCRIMMLNHPQARVSGLTLMDGCTRANNSLGGDIRIDGHGGTVSNCVFRNGKSLHFSSQGGALGMSGGLVTHCVFTGAFSTKPAYNADPSDKGVVVHINGANARLENSLIYDAVPTPVEDGDSHGPVVSVVNGLIRNCTIVPNTALFSTTSNDDNYKKWNTDGGCAIWCGNNATVENCAVAGLKNINGVLTPFGGTLTRFFNCVADGSQALGLAVGCKHATESEMFLDSSGRDYHPRVLGALVNYAKPVPEFVGGLDLSGFKRVVKLLDVGCYESQYVPGLVITGKRIDN